jgi:hypothetical protein
MKFNILLFFLTFTFLCHAEEITISCNGISTLRKDGNFITANQKTIEVIFDNKKNIVKKYEDHICINRDLIDLFWKCECSISSSEIICKDEISFKKNNNVKDTRTININRKTGKLFYSFTQKISEKSFLLADAEMMCKIYDKNKF